MRQQLATTLLSAVGASPRFVDDVIGDLEEITAERRDSAKSCGPVWYAGELLRTLPHALRDGMRGSAGATLVDVTQKALAAWILLAMAAVVMLAMLVFGFAALRGNVELGPEWLRSNSAIVLVFAAVLLRYPMLGYVSVWMDTKRPLLTLLTVAAADALLHAHFIGYEPLGPMRTVMPALAWSLIMIGGAWRLYRVPAAHGETLRVAEAGNA